MSHPIVVTFLILAIIAFMYFAAEFLRPLVLSVLLSFALSPIATFLERRGLPRFAAVILTVVVVLGTLGGVGMVVWGQLNALTDNIEQYQGNIEHHISEIWRPEDESTLSKINELGERVTSKLDQEPATGNVPGQEERPKPSIARVEPPQKVEIVERPTFRERLEQAVGPYLEIAALSSFVVILVMFILLNRDNLSDRIIQLFGSRRISLTTRTMDEVGRRISRFLGMLATYNAMIGLIVGVGLWGIGVEYAVLWGFLTGALRFIPYAGPASAFLMPLVFSIASSDTWYEPIMVIVLFGVIETISNGFLEPVLYGKTTGVSAVGLLVAAMFWTWLWGALGLLLSTPMTVCLAVLGKYVPSLSAFGTLLGEESELDPDVRYYQRILALDQDGATEIVEETLKHTPRVEVFDTTFIPALSRAERDFTRLDIDEREQAFLWRVTGDILNELDVIPEIELNTADRDERKARPEKVLGVASNDAADALVLRMLGQSLKAHDVELEVLAVPESALELSGKIIEKAPDLVLISHLPPVGLTPARYLVRRLRSRMPDLTIVVGRWGEGGRAESAERRLKDAGANSVVFTLAEARDRILGVGSTSERASRPLPDDLPGEPREPVDVNA